MNQPDFSTSPHPDLVHPQLQRIITELRTREIIVRLDKPIQFGQQLILARTIAGQEEQGRLVAYFDMDSRFKANEFQVIENALMREAKALLDELRPRLLRNGELRPAFKPMW